MNVKNQCDILCVHALWRRISGEPRLDGLKQPGIAGNDILQRTSPDREPGSEGREGYLRYRHGQDIGLQRDREHSRPARVRPNGDENAYILMTFPIKSRDVSSVGVMLISISTNDIVQNCRGSETLTTLMMTVAVCLAKVSYPGLRAGRLSGAAVPAHHPRDRGDVSDGFADRSDHCGLHRTRGSSRPPSTRYTPV